MKSNKYDLIKVINNNKNYLIIATNFFPAICEHCLSYIPYLAVPSAFYIAKADKWLCRDCMRKWFEHAKVNEISNKEKQNFEHVKQKLGL